MTDKWNITWILKKSKKLVTNRFTGDIPNRRNKAGFETEIKMYSVHDRNMDRDNTNQNGSNSYRQ